MRKTFVRRWLAALLTLAVAASLAPAALAASTISISPATLSLKVGEEKKLTATAEDTTGNPVTTGITWTSDDNDVATVSNGTVTGKKVGTARITASYDGKTATSTVTVTRPDIQVRVGGLPASIPVGSKEELTATVTVNGQTQTNAGITWSSSNPAVAKVVDDGSGVYQVEGVKSGSATMTALYTHTDGTEAEGKVNVKVVLASVDKLELEIDGRDGTTEDTTATLNTAVSESIFAEVDVTPTWSQDNKTGFTDGEWARVEWSAEVISGKEYISLPYKKGSGKPRVRVDGVKQTLNAAKAEIEIKVTYKNVGAGVGDKTETIRCYVTVGSTTRVVITEYQVATREIKLIKGGSAKTLKAYVAVDNGLVEIENDNDLVWSLSKSGIVSITPNKGSEIKVTAVEKGEVTLTAKYKNGEEQSVTCIVETESTDDNEPGGEDPGTPPAGDKLPDGVNVEVTIQAPASPHTMDLGATEDIKLLVTFKKGAGPAVEGGREWSAAKNMGYAVYIDADDGDKRYEVPIIWSSSNENSNEKVVKVNTVISGNSGRYVLAAERAGEATLEVSVNGVKAELEVTVKGFELRDGNDKITMYENETRGLTEGEDSILKVYGNADTAGLTAWPDNSTVASYEERKIVARNPGTTKFTVSANKGAWQTTFEVEVKPDPNSTINAGTIKSSETLKFSRLRSDFQKQAGGSLSHITGLNVDPSQGTLYYQYRSELQPGTGVGAGSYYLNPTAGQMGLEDITFVPNPSFIGGQVDINYTAVSTGGQNYGCRIIVIVDPQGGSKAGISLETKYNTPLKFSGAEFDRVCRERLGAKLSYVTFSQPPERQGTLYTSYQGAGNFGSVVDMRTHYDVKALDNVWFVPAPGYSGQVTVYYTAHAVGANGGSFSGRVDITVGYEDGVAIGGLAYDINTGGVARFDDVDFNRYCRQILEEEYWVDRQTLSYVRFDVLPDSTEGVLYYDYRSASNPGSRASAGTSYYYGSRTPRIDLLTFAPAPGYVGTIKLPFTGWTIDGTRFNGNVEINVRGGSSAGDIVYICAPGKSVDFDDRDFNDLSRDLTNSSLNYIQFTRLPGSSSGTLYYNNSRVSTSTRYRNGNSTPRIDNLSFRASSNFSGSVDIPFEGRSTSGELFHGVVTVSTSATGNGSTQNTVFTDMGGYSDAQRAAVNFLYERGITRGVTTTQYGPEQTIRRGDFARMLYLAFEFTPSTNTRAFQDVAPSAYYAQAVNALHARGIVSGIGGGLYDPDGTLSRQDAVCMVQRAMRSIGWSANDGPVSTLYSYLDGGSVDGYAQGAMSFAVQRGYLPTRYGMLSPTQALTRVDMAEIIHRVLTY